MGTLRPKKEEEPQASRLSIEEVGDDKEYTPPETKSDDEEEEKQDSHYIVLFADIENPQKVKQKYRLYLINAHNEEEFAKVLHKIMQLEKKSHNGTQVYFLSDCADVYRMRIKCGICAHCNFKIPVDEEKVHCQLASKDFLSFEELLALECKNCGSSTSQHMRLSPQESFKSCLEFQLICKKNELRTPSEAKIRVTALDSNGKILWKDEKSFAVCFNNMDGASTNNNQKKDYHRQVLKKNKETIFAKMTGEKEVIQFLIDQEVLRKDFETDKHRKDLIGSMLRHLLAVIPTAGSSFVLTQFINALCATNMPQNLELADILCGGK